MCAHQIKMTKTEVRKDGILIRSVTILSFLSIPDINDYFVQILFSHFTYEETLIVNFVILLCINHFQCRADEKISPFLEHSLLAIRLH